MFWGNKPVGHVPATQAAQPTGVAERRKIGSMGTENERVETAARHLLDFCAGKSEDVIKQEIGAFIQEVKNNVHPESPFKAEAKIIREIDHLNPSPQISKCLKEAAWPTKVQDLQQFTYAMDNLNISSKELEGFKNIQDFKESMKQVYEENMFHQKGIVPQWVKSKRAHPLETTAMVKFRKRLSIETFIKGNTEAAGYPHPYDYKKGSIKENVPLPEEESVPYDKDENFNVICDHFLHPVRIFVGLQKGGLSSILDILTEGTLYSQFTGSIDPNLRKDESAGGHGPWFALISRDYVKDGWTTTNEIPISKIDRFLVQRPEDKAYLLNALNNAVARGLMTEEKRAEAAGKIFTYAECAAEIT